MKKGEKIVKEYYAVKESEKRYFNDYYWGYDYDITELKDMDTLMEDIETAQYRKESEGVGTIQKIRVTYEVIEEEL